jgi:hypothetical protein
MQHIKFLRSLGQLIDAIFVIDSEPSVPTKTIKPISTVKSVLNRLKIKEPGLEFSVQ